MTDNNPVNPAHYRKAGGIETMDYIEAVCADLPGDEAPSVANVLKYVSRYRQKHEDDPARDLKKARWYLDRLIALVEARSPEQKPAETYDGASLRVRSIMLCKDPAFQAWVGHGVGEAGAADYLRQFCGIDSRAVLAWDDYAQRRFLKLDRLFKMTGPSTWASNEKVPA